MFSEHQQLIRQSQWKLTQFRWKVERKARMEKAKERKISRETTGRKKKANRQVMERKTQRARMSHATTVARQATWPKAAGQRRSRSLKIIAECNSHPQAVGQYRATHQAVSQAPQHMQTTKASHADHTFQGKSAYRETQSHKFSTLQSRKMNQIYTSIERVWSGFWIAQVK